MLRSLGVIQSAARRIAKAAELSIDDLNQRLVEGHVNSEEGYLSPSGVFIAADFRANLIIDRYDPVFADMRASKLQHFGTLPQNPIFEACTMCSLDPRNYRQQTEQMAGKRRVYRTLSVAVRHALGGHS
jgi:hypothetical protein